MVMDFRRQSRGVSPALQSAGPARVMLFVALMLLLSDTDVRHSIPGWRLHARHEGTFTCVSLQTLRLSLTCTGLNSTL